MTHVLNHRPLVKGFIIALIAIAAFAIAFTSSVLSAEIIVDNGDAGYSETGVWTYSADIGVNGDRSYTATVVGSPTKTATWTPTIPSSGPYQVYVSWVAHPNRTTNAPYTINYFGGSTIVTVDQTKLANGTSATGLAVSGWKLLGTFDFTAGSSGSVVLANNGSPSPSYVVADAVRLVSVNLQVDDDGVECPAASFTSIQAAINVAGSGDTITVCEGTYNEDLDINKSLTITGTDRVGVVVNNQMSGSDNYGISVTADNVTLEGMTVKNIAADDLTSSFQIHVSHVTGFDIHNVTLEGNGKTYGAITGLDLNTVSNVGINNVSVTGYSKNGIAITGKYAVADPASSNIVFANNVIVLENGGSDGWAGIAFYNNGGAGGTGDIMDVSFNGVQTISGSPMGIYFEGFTGGSVYGPAAADLDLGNTTFTSNSVADIVNGQVADVNAMSATFTGAADGFDIEDRIFHTIDASGVGLVSWELNTVYVTPNSFAPLAGTFTPSIQRGIDAVPGSTVNVAPGTYEEQLVINKDLLLVSSGVGLTFLNQPSSLVGDANGSLNLVTITGAVNVEITGLSLTGDGSGLSTGIYVRDGADANIHDNEITTIGSGGGNLGILVGRAAHSTVGTATIADNDISGYGKGGIVVDNVGSSANISGNTITGAGADPVVAQNGIQISRGATGTVSGNTVSDHVCTNAGAGCTDDPTTSPTADGASGILLYASGVPVEIASNILTGNQFNIWTVGAGDANIHDNNITGASGVGIAVWDSDQWTTVLGFTETATIASIENNTINNHDYGLLVRDYTPGGALPIVEAHNNDIVSNITGAWSNTLFDAENNRWGSCSGPYNALTNQFGKGDPASDNIDFDPWTSVCTSIISGKKFSDDNNNGVDDAEPGLQNWEIELVDLQLAGDPVVQTALTNVDGNYEFSGLDAGDYQIKEVQQTGWTQTTPLTPDYHEVTLAADDSTVADQDFGNFLPGSITIIKDAIDDDIQDFSFIGDLGTFDLDDDGDNQNTLSASSTFSGLLAGEYDVTELAVSGWDLTSASCTGGDYDAITDGVTIHLDAGENIICTFENTKESTLIIVKDSIGGDGTFDFDGSQGSFQLTTTSGTASTTFTLAGNSAYNVTEATTTGWDLTGDPSCQGTIQPGKSVTCSFENTKRGTIIVEKQTLPDGDPEIFNFTGHLVTSLSDDQTDMLEVEPGQYTVVEDLLTGWKLTDVSCDDGASVLPSIGSTSTATATFNVEPGEEVTCIFENTKNATLRVDKFIINDNGGTATTSNFNLYIDGNPVTSGQVVEVSVGAHDVSEDPYANYTGVIDGDCDAAGNVTLAAGEAKVCTITNDDDPASISGMKFNDLDGNSAKGALEPGLAGWTIELRDDSGVLLDSDVTDIDGNYSFLDLAADSYRVYEVEQLGWVKTEPGGPYHPVTLGLGDTAVRLFGNYHAGTIIVEKQTLPDGDSQTFDFTGNAAGTISDGQQIIVSGLLQGTYDSTETVPAGWDLTDITCVDSVDSNSSGDIGTGVATFNLEAGEIVTCTFTNTKRSTLIIEKESIGGDDAFDFDGSEDSFQLITSGGTAQVSFDLAGNESYDVYEVTPPPPSGWELTTDPQCLGNMAPGVTTTCTFVNTKQPTLTVIKYLPNDDGGTATADQWTCQITDDNDNDAVVKSDLCAEDPGTTYKLDLGTYSVSETGGPNGYQASYSADCENVTLAAGEHKTCTITNDDQPNTISGQKFNDLNGNGVKDNGEPGLQGWRIRLRDMVAAAVIDTEDTDENGNYTFINVPAGSYRVTERQTTGWQQTYPVGNGRYDLVLTNGENLTGKDFGNYEEPTLTVKKIVVNNNGGSAVVGDFILYIDGNPVISGVTTTVNIDSHVVSEDEDDGYTSTIGGDCDGTGNVALAPGDHKVCTITNDDIAPSLTLVKEVKNNNGGLAVASQWTLTATGPTSISGPGPVVSSDATFNAGSYDLLESGGPDGYTASSWVCEGSGSQEGNSISLALGATSTCTITNDDEPARIQLIKEVNDNYDGGALPDEFGLRVDGNLVLSGATTTVDANTPISIDEDGLVGYTFNNIHGHSKCPVNLKDTVTLDEGEGITCYIVNDDQPGSISGMKFHDLNGDGIKDAGEPGLEGWKIRLRDPDLGYVIIATETTDADGNYMFSGLAAKAWRINETLQTGWGRTVPVSPNRYDVTLLNGENVVDKNFGNIQLGTIIIEKQTLPDGDAQTFDFTGDAAGTISDGQQIIVTDLLPGQYDSTETVPAGWELTDITCVDTVDSNSSGDTGTATASFNLEPGETVTCTFNNTKYGSITIEKQTLPPGDAQLFEFIGEIETTLADDGTETKAVLPGEYEVTETVPAGWQLVSIVCNETEVENSSGDVNQAKATFIVEPGEDVTCVFNNSKYGSINGQKFNDLDGDSNKDAGEPGLEGWTIVLGGDAYATTTTDIDGNYEFNNLAVGNYEVSEVQQDGWVKTEPGSPYHPVILAAGESATRYFGNAKLPTLTIAKNVEPDDDPGLFNLLIDGNIELANVGDASTSTPKIVDLGSHEIQESAGTGTILGDYAKRIKCVDQAEAVILSTNGAGPHSVNLDPGDEVICTFTNTRRTGTLEIIKDIISPADTEVVVDDGGAGYADTGWTLSGNPPDAGYDDDMHYHASGTGLHTATWTPNLPSADDYRVYVSWTTHPNRAQNSPFTVTHTGGSDTFLINQEQLADQTTAGGSGQWSGWHLLGSFNFNAGNSGNVVLTDDADEYVIADAVKFVKSDDPGLFNLELDGIIKLPDAGDGDSTGKLTLDTGSYDVSETAGTGTDLNEYSSEIICRDLDGAGSIVAQASGIGPLPVPVGNNDDIVCAITNTRTGGTLEVIKELNEFNTASEIIVDNGDAEYGETGSWTYSADIGVNGDRSYAAGVGGSPTADATWTPSISVSGQYEVYASWVAHPNRATNAPYTINFDGGSSLKNVDQTKLADGTPAVGLAESGWKLLGTYEFAAGSSGNVVLANNANGYVVADAVRFVKGGTGVFDLLIDGNTEYADAGDGDTTGPVAVLSGSHTIGEAAGTNTDLSNYNYSIDCGSVDVSQNFLDPEWEIEVGTNENVVCTITNTRKTGYLEVAKVIIPYTDTGLFDLTIDGQAVLADAGNGDSTGEVEVASGTHQVGEAAGTGTDLIDYSSAVECRDQNGLGDVIASGQAPVNVDVSENGDVVCTITNERKFATVEGYKFDDLDGDGDWQTDSEPGLQGWTILALEPVPVSNFDVDSANDAPITSTTTLNDSVNYLIKVSGTYLAGDSITADAKYSVRAPNTFWTDSVQNYESYGPELLDLQIDGASPNWGSYNADHTYYLKVTGDGTGLEFLANDIHYPSNSGLLHVEIYEIADETITDDNGYYIFADLSEGDYLIAEELQDGWIQTSLPEMHTVNALEGVPVVDINFGNFRLGEVFGIKYEDMNGNGQYDDEEPLLQDWEIQLYDGANNLLATQLTDAFGEYEFTSLGIGDYVAKEVMPADIDIEIKDENGLPGYGDTGWAPSGNGPYHSAPSGNGSQTATWTPDIPETGEYKVYVSWYIHPNRATDAPFTVNYAGGSQTFDLNQKLLTNGTTSADFTPSGWKLLGSFNFEAGTTGNVTLSNNANGYVIADNVRFVRTWEQSQPGVKNDYKYEFTVEFSGTVGGGANFGNYLPATIIGRKFQDTDLDGVYDLGEPLLPNLDHPTPWNFTATNLFTGDKYLVSTNNNGEFIIEGVRPGTFLIAEETQDGWLFTTDPVQAIEVLSGQVTPYVDFGNNLMCAFLGSCPFDPFMASEGEGIELEEAQTGEAQNVEAFTGTSEFISVGDTNYEIPKIEIPEISTSFSRGSIGSFGRRR